MLLTEVRITGAHTQIAGVNAVAVRLSRDEHIETITRERSRRSAKQGQLPTLMGIWTIPKSSREEQSLLQ